MKKLILILIILFTTACNNYNEMNELALVTTMGIDYKDDKFKITTGIINFKDDKEGLLVLESESNTILSALRDLSLISSKKIYLEHLSVLVISEEVFETQLKNIIDFFKNYSKSPISFYVVTSKDASEIIKISSPLDSSNGAYISDTIELNNKFQGISTTITFDELLNAYVSDGISPILTSINTYDDFESDEKESKLIKIDGLVTLNKDNKLTNLTKEESIGYNLINNKVESTVFKIDCKDEFFTIELKWNDTGIKVENKNNFKLNMDIFGTVDEFNCGIKEPEKIDKYVIEETTKKLKEHLEKTIAKSKSSKTDFLGFGKYLYAYEYKYFDKIKDKFEKNYLKNINVDIEVKLDIDRVNNVGKNNEGSDYDK